MSHLLAADPTSVTLIANLRIRGVWQPQADVLFDVAMCCLCSVMPLLIVVVHHRQCYVQQRVSS